MEVKLDVDILKQSVCLEPVVGEELLPRYPDALSEEERGWFETHLKVCRLCQERLKLWRLTGQSMHIQALLEQAQDLLKEHRYAEAIEVYNNAVALDPNVLSTSKGRIFFETETWSGLTAAHTAEQDLLPYITPEYAPERIEMAAAATPTPFPLAVEFADGKVKGKLTSAGQSIFFELLESGPEFEAGVMLVGKLLRPVTLLKTWEIVQGQKHRLGTIPDLFGSTDFPDIVDTLRTFRVFPV